MLVKIFDLSHITSHQHYDIGLEAPTFSPFPSYSFSSRHLFTYFNPFRSSCLFYKNKSTKPAHAQIICSDCFIFELNHGEGRPF